MIAESPKAAGKARCKWPTRLLIVFAGALAACVIYVRMHPLVFNESFFEHAHCIPQAGGAFRCYARDNFGQFPAHTNGYGDALLLLVPTYTPWSILTGPGGYDSDLDKQWKQSGVNVPETECGRVYIQGLTETNNPEIVILFDKVPTPGGDHCHFLRRLSAPPGRDVLFLDGSQRTIHETEWQTFASNQIELLVKDGYDRTVAQQLYAEKGKAR